MRQTPFDMMMRYCIMVAQPDADIVIAEIKAAGMEAISLAIPAGGTAARVSLRGMFATTLLRWEDEKGQKRESL